MGFGWELLNAFRMKFCAQGLSEREVENAMAPLYSFLASFTSEELDVLGNDLLNDYMPWVRDEQACKEA